MSSSIGTSFAIRVLMRMVLLLAVSLILPKQAESEPVSGTSGSSDPADKMSSTTMAAVETILLSLSELRSELHELRNEVESSRSESEQLKEELRVLRGQLAKLSVGTAIPFAATHPVSNSPLLAAQPQQDSPVPDGADSGMMERLEKELALLREDQDLMQGNLRTQYQTKLESGSKYRVRFSGMALLNLFGSRGAVDNIDNPTIAEHRGQLDSGGSFGATVRQSVFGFEVFGPTIAGARTSGNVQFDFSGGFAETENGVVSGLPRIRTGGVRFDWEKTSIVAAQEEPFFSPRSPTSLASLASPAFSYAGNMWTWIPQIHISHREQINNNGGVVFQGGILDPLTGESPADVFYLLPSAGQKSGLPGFATRIGWSSGPGDRPLGVGIGSFYSRQSWGGGRTVDAWAVTADWQIPLGEKMAFSGEFYRGRSLGGFGAGPNESVLVLGDFQDPATRVIGLNSAGGWAQLKFTPLVKWEFNGVFGQDVPFQSDLNQLIAASNQTAPPIRRNMSAMMNTIYRLGSNLLLSAEYRRLWTRMGTGDKPKANHISLGAGIIF